MVAFIGRTDELAMLERLYSTPGYSACAIYGRRRVGKTTLIDHFCEGKPHILMEVSGGTKTATMDGLRRDISDFLGKDIGEMKSPRDLTDVLEKIDGPAKTVIVLDEFPRLVDLFDETPGVIQRYIDLKLKKQNVMLIICGSSIKSMSEELDDSSRPLFGRFNPRFKLEPMPYVDARRFHEGMSEEDRIRMYCICSGIPMYHELMNRRTVRENISEVLLGNGGLRDEAENALSRELPSWKTCRSILTAISEGRTTASDIAGSLDMSFLSCQKNLDDLVLSNFVDSYVPWGKEKPRMYRISDGVQLFFYEVRKGRDAAYPLGSPGKSYETLLPLIETFYGRRFEKVCMEYLRDTADVEKIGSWAGKVPRMRFGEMERNESGKPVLEDVDIDIVAKIREGKRILTVFAECKFTSSRCGTDVLDELIRRSVHASDSDNRRYYIFSRSGFMPELVERAGSGVDDVVLVGMDDIRKWAESTDAHEQCDQNTNRIRYQT